VDQLFTLAGLLGGAWEFAHPVYMCFVDLEKAYDCVPRGILWGVLREYVHYVCYQVRKNIGPLLYTIQESLQGCLSFPAAGI